MKLLSRTKTLAAAALAAATFATPSLAQANTNYQKTSRTHDACVNADTNNRVVGGLIGAVAGGVAGSQLAARGVRTEGSALGAVIGAVAGSELAGARVDCRNLAARPANVNINTTRTAYNTGYNTNNNTGYSNTGYNNRGYTNTSYNNVSRFDSRYARYSLYDIECQLDELHLEGRRLKDRARYNNSYRLERRIDEIRAEIRYLKDRRDILRKRVKNNNRRSAYAY